MEYSEDIVLMLTVNREDVLRPYQSHKLVWAGIQWLEAPFWFFCPLAQLGSPGKTHEYSAHLLPVALLVHIPLADARGGGPRGGVGEIVAEGGGGCSLGRCGGSSWHPKVTFQNASMVLRRQTSQGQVSGWALIYSATTPKSAKNTALSSAADQGKVIRSHMQNPAVCLPIRAAAPRRNACTMKRLAGREKCNFRRHIGSIFSEITQIWWSVIAFISFCGYIHKHPTSR